MDETTTYAGRLRPFVQKWRATGQRVAIFGIGPHTDYLFTQVPELETVNIVGYLDNNQSLQGTEYRGREVHPPPWAERHADLILCSSFVNELQMAESVALLNCKVVTSHTPLSPGSRPSFTSSRVSGGDPSLGAEGAIVHTRSEHRFAGRYSSTFDVFVFPIIDWDFRFQRPQQLAVHLAQAGHRVFYVRNTFLEQIEPVVKEMWPRVFTVHLPGPAHTNIYSESMGDELRQGILAALASLRLDYHVSDAVCLVDLPYWAPLALALRERYGWRVVYDCMDHHSGFSNTAEAMLSHEEELTRRSDLVLASSQALFEAVSSANPRCCLLPNAVDFDHFRFAVGDPPSVISALSRPILGYYGAIAEWFDSELVAFLARERPQWSIVLIGHTHGADLRPLQSLANVLMLPEQKYDSLPSFLHSFDVCLIPFKKTALTHATNPVKLFEYCSSGRPVVASALRELEAYSPLVRLPRTRADWLREIASVLGAEDAAQSEARIGFARDNTWTKRVAALIPRLKSLFGKASIVIVTFNNLELTRLCLESVFAKTSYPDFEVIVVDNDSSDGTPKFLQEFSSRNENCRVVLNETNVGFARANNQGARLSGGEYLIFLNNDTIVTPNWLSALVTRLRDKTAGLVGPVTNWSGNETRIPVSYRALRQIDEFAEARMRSHERVSFEVRMLPFCCVGVRREVYEEVGPLDERYGIGMFEDDDYAMQVQAKGYRILCIEDAFIHHWGRASFAKLDGSTYEKLFERNRRQFEEKWGTTWKPHRWREPGQSIGGDWPG